MGENLYERYGPRGRTGVRKRQMKVGKQDEQRVLFHLSLPKQDEENALFVYFIDLFVVVHFLMCEL